MELKKLEAEMQAEEQKKRQEVINNAKKEEKKIHKQVYSIKTVHDCFKKWLFIKDIKRVDVMLAVALTRKLKGTKLWLIFVGLSGDMKSEQLKTLDDEEIAYYITKFTPRTLVSGFHKKIKVGKEYKTLNLDLAPKLNNRILLVPEMAQLLTLHQNIKAEIWSQFRDLYDGYASLNTGTGVETKYTDLNVTFLGGSTPAIDHQILIHQSLGTRELLYRTNASEKNCATYVDKILSNEKAEEQMRKELKNAVLGFLRAHEYNPKVKITKRVKDEIVKNAEFLSYMRASALSDSYTGELLGDVHKEKISRTLKQFKRLFIALKSLDEQYSTEEAIEVIKHITESSADQIRLKLLDYLIEDDSNNYSISKIASALRLGKKTIVRQLFILWNLGLIERESMKDSESGKGYWIWKLNKNHEMVLWKKGVSYDELKR
ncbi:ArsR family transcriptional regulator [Candidatus Woesearchaeota archaeon]|nr:ArsR family transcriptional regulator [Candidatus Woesearchaeota archaeon]MBW3006365.1 ArsR family transcriptional regulator [Candidatus Woesearchaeota archaeon]